MRKRRVRLAAVVLVATCAVGIGTARSVPATRTAAGYGPAALHPKEAVYERDVAGVSEPERAAAEQVENRAFPRGYVESSRALAARRAFVAKPTRLTRADFRTSAAAAAQTTVRTSWQELGPITPTIPAEVTYTGVPTLNSGRVTAMAIDPNCGQPHMGCRLWVTAGRSPT